MGLGEPALVPLAAARQKALDCRSNAALAKAKSVTLESCALAGIEARQAGQGNARHADQWRNTLQSYVFPILGALPVQDIDTMLVMKVLEPIWQTRTKMASRVRGRLEAILDWATVRHHRQGDNPTRRRGHLDHLLPQRAKGQSVLHHPALPLSWARKVTRRTCHYDLPEVRCRLGHPPERQCVVRPAARDARDHPSRRLACGVTRQDQNLAGKTSCVGLAQ